jgi:hypothetical protein
MEFDLLRRLGIEVVEAPALCVPGAYVAPLNLVVVRAGMSHAAREYCAQYLLSEVSLAPEPSPAE